jgi:hypothetical protein
VVDNNLKSPGCSGVLHPKKARATMVANENLPADRMKKRLGVNIKKRGGLLSHLFLLFKLD